MSRWRFDGGGGWGGWGGIAVVQPLPSTGGEEGGGGIFTGSGSTVVTGGCCLSCERATAVGPPADEAKTAPITAPVSRSPLVTTLFFQSEDFSVF